MTEQSNSANSDPMDLAAWSLVELAEFVGHLSPAGCEPYRDVLLARINAATAELPGAHGLARVVFGPETKPVVMQRALGTLAVLWSRTDLDSHLPTTDREPDPRQANDVDVAFAN